MHVGRESILLRARAARREALEHQARACELVTTAARVGADSLVFRGSCWRRASRRLEWETAAADSGVVAWPVMRRFVEFDSGVVGRDLVIEDAKTLLCDQLGIGRAAAFQMLRGVSSRRNMKLRDVARTLVDASHAA